MNSSASQNNLAALRALLPVWDVDAVLITNGHNRRWLTGFTGSFGFVLVSAETATLATDSRYWLQAETQAPAFALHKFTRTATALPDLLAATGFTRIGIEAKNTSLEEYMKLKQVKTVNWVPLKETVEPLRAVKSSAEIEKIKAAAAITDHAMQLVPTLAHLGITERQLAWQLEKTMRENGADGMAFNPIVAFGANAANAHYTPGDIPLKRGDAVLVDMGAQRDGYYSDLTRTFFMGNAPTEKFIKVWQTVRDAHQNAIDNVFGGISSVAADALARDLITAAGYGEHFGHSLGHSLGLEIHESPSASPHLDVPIPTGAMLTIEPGIYLPDWGGVRIEDLVLITADGCQRISKTPYTNTIPC